MHMKFQRVPLFLILTVGFLFAGVSAGVTDPMLAYWDSNLFDDTTPFTLDFTNLGDARSLYEMQKHAYEGRGSFMFMQYFPPVPYAIEQLFTNALDGIGQFAADTSDLEFILICDEPYLSGMTKAGAEAMVAHAKSRLPNHKFGISFGAIDLNNPGNVVGRGGFPSNLDYALLNWYPFDSKNRTTWPTNKSEFDTAMQNLLNIVRPLANANTKFIFTAQCFQNIVDPVVPPAESIQWYQDWVDSESDVVGIVMYRYIPSPGEYGTRELENMYGGYIAQQTQTGRDWGIMTSITPPAPGRQPLPSSWDRQKWNTFAGHEGWDNAAGATHWIGVFGDQAHSGIQSLRIRNTSAQGNSLSRPVPAEAAQYGELEMYVKVTQLAGTAVNQICTLFPGYDDVNKTVSGLQQFMVLVDSQQNNYLLNNGIMVDSQDTGFAITGGWDHIVVRWDVDQDAYLLYVNGAGPAVLYGPYDGTDQIAGVRIFAAADPTIGADPYVYDPPVGTELWIDDIDMYAADPLNALDEWCDDFESYADGTIYPLGWEHTGLGGADAGMVEAGTGTGGSQGFRIVGEWNGLDGYSRNFGPFMEGMVEFDFSLEAMGAEGSNIHVIDLGDEGDLWPRFEMFVSDNVSFIDQYLPGGLAEAQAAVGNYLFWWGSGWLFDTGIAAAGPGEFHRIVYRWYADKTDDLWINGDYSPLPSLHPNWANRRQYGVLGLDLNAGIVRIGVSMPGDIAVWDNICVKGAPFCRDSNWSDPNTADVTGDCHADYADFSEVAANWLRADCEAPGQYTDPTNNWCWEADINHSGAVDWDDLLYLIIQWLECTDPRGCL